MSLRICRAALLWEHGLPPRPCRRCEGLLSRGCIRGLPWVRLLALLSEAILLGISSPLGILLGPPPLLVLVALRAALGILSHGSGSGGHRSLLGESPPLMLPIAVLWGCTLMLPLLRP